MIPLTCLHGPCMTLGAVVQIPAPWVHPGKSAGIYETIVHSGIIYIFIPLGAWI